MNREGAPGKSPEEMYIQQKVRVLLMLRKMGSNLTASEEEFLRTYAGVVSSQLSQLPQHSIDQGAVVKCICSRPSPSALLSTQAWLLCVSMALGTDCLETALPMLACFFERCPAQAWRLGPTSPNTQHPSCGTGASLPTRCRGLLALGLPICLFPQLPGLSAAE
ncbi:beta-catenin-interacting protein 1 isoform X1 [Marmota flaviventris]|uniref:beta-catenin-interacting protein 1 isoform X1 n=1 Tax=Marmota flaviventris TaxID=93162 RepID=UPI003A854B59